MPLRARLAAKTSHALWYVQDGLDVAARDLQAPADAFEQRTYPTVHQGFGWDIPPGRDDTPRVTILIGHLARNGFGLEDLLPRWLSPGSNERPMIYADVDTARPGEPLFDTRLAVALTRMAWETGHPDQDYWVKEGTSLVVAEEATGSLRGFADPNALSVFALSPQTQLNAWRPEQANPPSLAADAARYLFARYVADHFGGTAAFQAVFAAPGRGIGAYDRLFRSATRPRGFDDVFADWVAANVLGDATLDDGRFGYPGARAVGAQVGEGPALGESVGGQASQFGATYYRVQPSAAATLRFVGDATVPLIGANPHGGGYEWWSNGGDMIDSRLTRAVDLRATTTATLRFWTWFETEKDDDYAYVEVSTDGGATWRTLAAPDTTRDDPHGANLGDGFTGASGGGPPRWVEETADLTSYAGRAILLRFEYVTDQGVQGDGFVVDEVLIPEVGFRDAATSDNGWTAEGFVRTDNLAPQPWLVEALTRDPAQPVRPLRVGPDGTGSLPLDAGQSVVLAIAGLAPNSTQRATYHLTLTAP